VASDATAFTDKVLVLGLVKDIEDVGDAGGAALQRLAAEALMTRANDAVDAAVSARSRDGMRFGRLTIHLHRRRIIRIVVLRLHVDANDESRQQAHRKPSHLVITANKNVKTFN